MFERFTDRARHVLVLAQQEARLMNHNFIGTEHLLLGLICEGEGVAAKALESLGVQLEAVRALVEQTVGQAGSSTAEAPPFTPRSKKVLELAMREALQLGHNYIGTEHLLLGLVREGEGVGTTVLRQLGVDLGAVRQSVVEILSGYSPVVRDAIKPPDPPDPPEPPVCWQCRLSLAETLEYRVIDATRSDGPPVPVMVAYCGTCGTALGVFGTSAGV